MKKNNTIPTCDCEDFEHNMKALMDPAMFEFARNPQNFKQTEKGYELTPGVKQFKFCPWCGEELNGPGFENKNDAKDKLVEYKLEQALVLMDQKPWLKIEEAIKMIEDRKK